MRGVAGYFIGQLRTQHLHVFSMTDAAGLGNEIKRTALQGAHSCVRPLLGMRTDHDHADGKLIGPLAVEPADGLKGCHAVHTRHFKVESD